MLDLFYPLDIRILSVHLKMLFDGQYAKTFKYTLNIRIGKESEIVE